MGRLNLQWLKRGKKMDLRKVPGLENTDIVCPTCGGVYLVEIDEKGNPCLECNQCKHRKYEDNSNFK